MLNQNRNTIFRDYFAWAVLAAYAVFLVWLASDQPELLLFYRNLNYKSISIMAACVLSLTYIYLFITGMGVPGELTAKLASDTFKFQLTNGAVFGFAAGIIAFFSSYFGERLAKKFRGDDDDERRRKKQRKHRKKSFAAEYTKVGENN